MASEPTFTRWRKAILLSRPENDICHLDNSPAALTELSNRLNVGFMTSMVKRKGSNDLIAKDFHEGCVSVTDVQFCEEF
jgi:hypothetical protein